MNSHKTKHAEVVSHIPGTTELIESLVRIQELPEYLDSIEYGEVPEEEWRAGLAKLGKNRITAYENLFPGKRIDAYAEITDIPDPDSHKDQIRGLEVFFMRGGITSKKTPFYLQLEMSRNLKARTRSYWPGEEKEMLRLIRSNGY